MTDRTRTTGDDRSQDTSSDGFGRREFVALGAGASATLLAGCAGDGALPSSGGSDGGDGTDGADGSETLTGTFRLLISDAPADIDDFDQLNVTLSEARVFESGEGDEEDGDEDNDEEADEDTDDESDQPANETESTDDSPNGTDTGGNETDEEDEETDDADESEDENEEADEEDDESDEEDENDDSEERGFTVVDIGGETVDLTQVIGEDATAVFDGEITAGSYEKVELEVSAVEGIVDGETVDVKLPSEKLQITNGFEVTPDEPVSFVFDINVVKRGPNNGYILKPVISGSGVAGRDVDVNEIDEDDDDDSGEDDSDEEDSNEDDSDETDETEDPEDEDDDAAGNETDDTGNETDA